MRLETFFEKFELLADAPNGVQKLRELILQSAVQGKLVPQDPNDEPASLLLEKIKVEKEQLIKEKKIRKSEPLPPIALDEVSYELPEGWQWTRLGTIGVINPRNNLEDDKTASFIPMNLIPQVYGEQVKSETQNWGDIKKGFTHFAECDVVLAKINPCFQNGKAAVMRGLRNGVGAGTTELHVFRPLGDFIYSEYVLLYLKSPNFVNDGIPRMTGTAGQQRVPNNYFSENPFPLPPIKEQKRIVAKVDQLMALCDELETRQQKRREGCVRLNNTAIAQLLTTREPDDFSKHWQRICDNFDLLYSVPKNVGKLRQAILQLAVQGKLVPQDPNDEPASVLLEKIKAEKERLIKEGKINKSKPLPPIKPDEEPYALPSGWAWVRIDDFYEVVGGIQKTPKRKPVSHYFPYLRVANVYRGKLELSEITYFEVFENELQRWKLKAGDLLIVEGNGSEKEIGRCAVWNEEIENCVHQNHLIRVRSIGHKGELFTLLFLNSPDGMSEMKRLAITTSGLYSLSVGKIRGIVVPLPPLLEQQRILRKVEQLMSLCDELEAKLTQSQTNIEKLMDAVVRQVLTA